MSDEYNFSHCDECPDVFWDDNELEEHKETAHAQVKA